MKLSEVKQILSALDVVRFKLENGVTVPEHFHVTEIGMISKKFIDCGGTIRNEEGISLQLWSSNDYQHRLKPAKLQQIFSIAEKELAIDDLHVEIEYQSETIGKYDLGFDGKDFILLAKTTACLAQENCGLPKEKAELKDLQTTCSPNGGCC